MRSHHAINFIAFFLLFFISCNSTQKKSQFPDSEMYNFSNPKVLDLPMELDEISGIAYYPKDTSVFAIVDEDGMLYKISLKNPEVLRSWRFDKKRDYEDLLLIDTTFYVLVSSGDIVKVNFTGDKLTSTKIELSSASKNQNEFESMFQDSNKIIILCKSCDVDTKNQSTSYSCNLNDSIPIMVPHNSINYSELFKNKPKNLKASAAAVNPITNEIYIISAIENLLVVTSMDGKLKSSFQLNPKIYKQPEGIAFTPEGDLIISNEYAENGHSNLLLMKNKIQK